MDQRDDKKTLFIKAFFNVAKKGCIIIFTILFCILGSIYTAFSIYISSAISTENLKVILIVALVFTFILFLILFIILCLSYREMRANIDEEVRVSVDKKLKCQDCMGELFEIQKRLYNIELESFIQTLTVEDVQKINLLVHSLNVKGDTISEDQIVKIQQFVDILIRVKQCNKFPPYITLNDMKIIGSQVENKSAVHIISSSISCDDELENTIIENLKRGVCYHYYFPRDKGIKLQQDAKFKELINQFNKNLQSWQSDPAVTDAIIQKQITCYWFPEEYMQMSITFYNFQKSVLGGHPAIIVKFPSISADIIHDYPLFFYIDGKNSISDSFCNVLNFISKVSSTSYFKRKSNGGNLEIHFSTDKKRK